MKKLHFTATIKAPKVEVWNTMLEDKTYREWTSAFHEGSHYEGSWEEGSEIRFLDPDGNGMVSVIAENRPYEFISVKHVGIINDGVEDTESEEAKKWAPAFESYSFVEKEGKTTVSVEMDIEDEYEDMFNEMWPNALRKLKDLCEK
ncbi:MAG TPA: SRPBCC domain-containing protein [Balneolaceae bacterium]|nr:SRPBCC domain-containing protein [Balneolaceae bacterium]